MKSKNILMQNITSKKLWYHWTFAMEHDVEWRDSGSLERKAYWTYWVMKVITVRFGHTHTHTHTHTNEQTHTHTNTHTHTSHDTPHTHTQAFNSRSRLDEVLLHRSLVFHLSEMFLDGKAARELWWESCHSVSWYIKNQKLRKAPRSNLKYYNDRSIIISNTSVTKITFHSKHIM